MDGKHHEGIETRLVVPEATVERLGGIASEYVLPNLDGVRLSDLSRLSIDPAVVKAILNPGISSGWNSVVPKARIGKLPDLTNMSLTQLAKAVLPEGTLAAVGQDAEEELNSSGFGSAI